MLSGLLDGLAVSHLFKMSSLMLPLKAGEDLVSQHVTVQAKAMQLSLLP